MIAFFYSNIRRVKCKRSSVGERMHQRSSLFSSPSISFQRIIKAGNFLLGMSFHRTANDLMDFTETEAMVEERIDGNFVRGIHCGWHSAADSKRLVPEIKARKAIMVGFAKG